MRGSHSLLLLLSLAVSGIATPALGQIPQADVYTSNDPEIIRNGLPDEPAAQGELAASYGKQQVGSCALAPPPVVPTDVTKETGIMPFSEVVRKACDLAAKSNRIQLINEWKAVSGRDVFAIKISSADTNETKRAEALRTQLVKAPDTLKSDLATGKAQPWRQTLMVSANIHGSEGEGTDTLMALATYLAQAKDTDPAIEGNAGGPTVGELLAAYDLILVPSVNPDGRTSGTRRNAEGIDLNRDHVTRSQPETRALQDLLQRFQPVMHLDLHGYYNPNGEALGLVEPATTPHAIAMDRPRLETRMQDWVSRLDGQIINRPEVKAVGFDAKRVGVAMRDEPNGRWDDWAPLYTSVWSTLMNGAGVTVEAPFNPFSKPLVDGKSKEVQGNIAFLRGAVDAMVLSAMAKKDDLFTSLLDYRIQAVSGAKGTTGQDWPEGWIIKKPTKQYPTPNVTRLVENLRGMGVTVIDIGNGNTVAGTEVPPGSYWVPASQAYRALASVTLSPGGQVPGDRTTDLAAWSPGSLWGVDVVEIPKGTSIGDIIPAVPANGSTTPAQGPWVMTPRSGEQVALVNTLLKGGAELYRNPATGEVLIPARHHEEAKKYGDTHHFEALTKHPTKVERLRNVKVGITSEASSVKWLEKLGYETVYVDFLNDPKVPADLDVLILTRHVGAQVATNIHDWVKAGGALIAIDGGQHMLKEMGMTSEDPHGVGRRAAGLLRVNEDGNDPRMPGRLGTQVELVEPYSVWNSLPSGFEAVQTVPEGSAITSGLWPEQHKTQGTGYLTIAGEVGSGRIIASGAQRILRHHMVGQADELFDWIQWVTKPSVVDNPLPTLRRIGGATRLDTALSLAEITHPKTAETIVLSSATSWADTLVAGPLATKRNAPMLLSGKDTIDPKVLDRIKTLAPKEILVVGGPEAISNAVLAQLRAIDPIIQVSRFGGATRYETAAQIATQFPAATPTLIATGVEPADALTGGVLSARQQGVTLLTPPTGPIPQQVLTQINRLDDPEISVIGGPVAIPDTTVSELTQGKRKATRIAGATRYETAVAVAKLLDPSNAVAVANADSTADSLLATPMVHHKQGAILLSDPKALPKVTKDEVTRIAPKELFVIGGPEAISDQVMDELAGISR